MLRERATLAALHTLTLLPRLSGRAHRRIGLLQARAGRPAEAAASFEAALAAGLTARADTHHQLAQALLATGQADAATEHFRRAIELDPMACWSHQGAGQALAADGRMAEAEAAFRRGLAVCPGYGWLAYHLAEILIGQQRDAEALDLLIDTGTAATGAPPPVLPSAPIFMRTDLATAERIAALRKTVARFPDHQDYLVVLTRLLSAAGDYAEATDRLEGFRILQWARRGPGAELKPDPGQPMPAFLIIGQGKAGTTALDAYLCQHPQVLPAITKEVRYWSDFPAAGLDWYRAHFPPIPAASGLITGDASPQYLVGRAVPAQVARDLPNVKLIVLLRDPVSRAYSAYRMFQRIGRELRPWEAVVEDALARTPVCPLQPEDFPRQWDEAGAGAVLVRSAALPFLRGWLKHFPPEQFLILHHEDLRRDTAGTVRRVYRFLGLPDFVPDCGEKHNVGHYQPMSPAIRQRLDDWFAPHQQALGELLVSLGVAPPAGQNQRDRGR